MPVTTPRTLDEYIALQYPFNVIADPDGGYVIEFPDLPGCMTQAENVNEIPEMAEEARQLWIETAYDDGQKIPLPSYPEEYSGKFVVRIPRSLHRSLAETAQRDAVSLNNYVGSLLSRGDAEARMGKQFDELKAALSALQRTLRIHVSGIPRTSAKQQPFLRVVGWEVAA
ncbi:MAG TPA: type II toxin-antitoxin system HicB family antitoxin [Dehalococcoidia bacterium]|nr:type II toxin-antitoxin system HicB family antitoxin [Dehalococcoidia bacterium]